MATLQLPVGSYRRFTGSVIRLVNIYAESAPQQAKGPILLNRIPGISEFGTFATGGARGAAVWDETAYAVIGGTLYEIDNVGSTTSIGSITGSGRLSIAPGTQLGIVTNTGTGYTYDGSSLSQITDPDFPSGARGAAMLDDFMFVFTQGTDQVNASDFQDFTSWSALAFENAFGAEDQVVGLASGQSKLYIGGSRSTEIWYNAGLSPFPLQRVPNGVIDLGLVGQYTQVIIDNSVCWLAHDGTVRVLRGLTPQRISTHAVEAAIAGYTDQSSAFALAMTIGGHSWYVLTFPNQATWVFDFTTGEWHERETLQEDRWNVDAYIRAYNKDLAFYGDKVGEIDQSEHDEFGTEIRGQWTYPAVYGEGRRAYHKRLEIRAEVGVGNQEVAEPKLTLELSDDGGKIFTAMPTRSLGKVGEYRKRVLWTRLGSANDRVYRVSMADPARLHIWSTELEVEGGRLIGDR